MNDLATQRETSRKTIRYEAHKFRQKNSRYYQHPLGASDEVQKTAINIAPPNWKPQHENQPTPRAKGNNNSDSETEDEDFDSNETSPRKLGIITRSKKPTVSFSVKKEVQQIENDLEIDDLENEDSNDHESVESIDSSKVRALSAPQSRDAPQLPGQVSKRQQSAFPVLRSSTDCISDDQANKHKAKNMSEMLDNEKNRRLNDLTNVSRSENYFDKSKAAYLLRQDLKRRAKMRKEGIKTSVFTLQDAINLEKDNFLKSRDRVVDYIKRIESL
jgi:hypothetical protein